MTDTEIEALIERLMILDSEPKLVGAITAALRSLLAERDSLLKDMGLANTEMHGWIDEVTRLKAENDSLKVDGERLSFVIDKQGIIVSQAAADGVRRYALYQICEYGTGVILSGRDRRFDSPREAIDAAIQASKEQK